MILSCKKCDTVFNREVKFCTNCGTEIQKSSIQKRKETLNLIIAFYVVFLGYALVSFFVYDDAPESLAVELILESIFALMVIVFSSLDFKNILELYKIPKFNWLLVSFSILFPILSSFLVYFSMDLLNTSLLETISENYYESYTYLEDPLLWSVIFIAILPPIFEELAFRGFLFNQLQKVVTTRVTIVATAFIFALVHFSFISFLWIFPFGLVLGYLRSKYKTLWYGIIVHFIHNLIVLLIDYYVYHSWLLESNF